MDDNVIVTWGVGDLMPVESVEYFGYEVYYYGPDGNGGKRFGVRFGSKTTAHIWDHESNTQANYDGESVTMSAKSIVVRYRDADLGLKEVGTIAAFSHINGDDIQVEIPVALLR